MTRIFVLIAGLIIIFALACYNSSVEPIINENIVLSEGQSLTIEQTHIRIGFDSVLTDSRCPISPIIYCIWSGYASIRVWVDRPGSDREYFNLSIPGFTFLETNMNYPYVKAGGINFRLRQLNPHPVEEPSEENYTAWLELRTDNLDGNPQVMITDEPPLGFLIDPYEITDFTVTGKTASVGVRHGGGCTDHDHYLIMSPAEISNVDSSLSVNLYIQHLGYGDMCEALITEQHQFDLSPIIDLYLDQYIGYQEPVRLQIYEFDGNDITLADWYNMNMLPFYPLD